MSRDGDGAGHDESVAATRQEQESPAQPAGRRGASCPFCQRIERGPEPIVANALAVAFADAYPVSPGHTLIVSRRHVPSFAELRDDERRAIWELVPRARQRIEEDHAPDGSNLGLNDGAAAGQTVAHVHLHVIPRYAGDAEDPRGGVRWVVPERAPYWDQNP